MTKTMEALLSKSAKLRDNHMTLKEDQADERQGVVKKNSSGQQVLGCMC